MPLVITEGEDDQAIKDEYDRQALRWRVCICAAQRVTVKGPA
ncbi:hypothetical protein [Caballeronia sp. LjRoot31]